MFFEHDFYGDKNLRWFIGRAVNNRDPAMEGRIQIHIDGIHSPNQADIGPDQLPWAITMSPTTEGGTSGIGRFSRIQPGALVYGVFLDGETSQIPMIMGVLNQYERPSFSQSGTNEIRHNSTTLSNETSAAINAGTQNLSTGTPTTTPSLETTSSASINARRWACMNFFCRDNGLTLAQAAGITGNLQQESSLIASAQNSIGAIGLAQWLGSRKQQLLNFASLKGRPWQNFDLQLEFIMHELRGTPLPNSSADRDGASKERNAYSYLLQSTKYTGGETLSNSTWAFCIKYERPGVHERVITRREEYAVAAYNTYVSSTS